MMRKRFSFFFVGLFIFSLLLLPMGTSPSVEASIRLSGSDLLLPPRTMDDSTFFSAIESEIGAKDGLDASQKKLSGSLLALMDDTYLPEGTSTSDLLAEMKDQGQISQMPVCNGNATSSETGIYVYIRMNNGYHLDTLEPYILALENYDEETDLAAAWVDIDQLGEIASLAAVSSITEVMAPEVHGMGSATSLGDSVLRANQMRSTYGVDGSGVKIGVISDGVDHLSSAVADGDLPNSVSVLGNSYGGDEGTAMLEIIYDLAPGTKLYFHDCGSNALAFNSAIDDLVAAGCDIICDDIGWVDEPFFEDGVVAQHVKEISDRGKVLFVSAAGNDAENHYQGTYYNDGYNFHDFSGGTSANLQSLYVGIPKDESVTIVFQWNDPTGNVTADYDLYLMNSFTGDMLGIPGTDHNISSGVPCEWIQYENNTGSDIMGEILVRKASGYGSDILEVFIYGGVCSSKNLVAADSIYGHPAVPGVLACGAIDASTPDLIEYYSSLGPVTMISGTREKPDICGVDGVAVTGAGGFSNPFYGTSAAAPHVAAVAALEESRFSSLSAEEIRNIILNSANAVDLGAVGYDYTYGYGRIDALKIASAYCNVSFDSCGGSSVPAKVVWKGGNATPPSTPHRSGHAFAGWYADKELTQLYDFDTAVMTDKTLYARWTISFNDVNNDAWYAKGVNFVAARNLFNGVSSDLFAPDDKMTRAMFVTVLYRYAGSPAVNPSDNNFTDVSAGNWYTNGVIWAVEEGVTNGVGNDRFDPNAPITREAIVTMLNRYLERNSIQLPFQYDKITFADDADISAWAKESVEKMQRTGLVNGMPNNDFCPHDNATRAQVATILYRLILSIEDEV